MGTQVEPSVKAACLLSSLRRASRAVTQLYDLVLAPVKLKATQLFILTEINRSGELAQHEFAERYGVGVETLSRRFCVLRRKGLLVCRSGPRKEQIYSLTPHGKETLARPCGIGNLLNFACARV
jgi:DNA-binding MarR family transcriptional regulator